MGNKQIKYIVVGLVLILTIYSCKFFSDEVIESFGAIDKEIRLDTEEHSKKIMLLKQQLTDSAMSNPEKYAGAFNHMNEFHSKSERLLAELNHARNLIEEQIGTTTDYGKMDENTDSLFFIGDEYSDNGNRFVQAIKDYNLTSSDQLFFFPEAEKIAQEAFSIDTVQDRSGNEVDWFSYNYKGYPAIASIAKITLLESEVKEVEITFLKALIEKPQF